MRQSAQGLFWGAALVLAVGCKDPRALDVNLERASLRKDIPRADIPAADIQGGDTHGAEARPKARLAEPLPTSPWASRSACLQSLSRQKVSGKPRVASWNVRWFPDGTLSAGAARTDIEWVACLVLHLDAPLVAVQEFREGDANAKSVRTLLDALGRLGGGQWDAAFDGCPGNRQHVGFVFDRTRVAAEDFQRLDALNPKGGCKGLLRPGYAGYFRFPHGPDLHVVSVHFKSGVAARDLDLRKQSLRALPQSFAALQALEPDTDVLLMGDLNSMGGKGISRERELSLLDRSLESQQPGWRRVPASAECSEISSHKGALLDHALVTRSTIELATASVAQVSGLCRELGCDIRASALPALQQVSDHCPLVVELEAQDRD